MSTGHNHHNPATMITYDMVRPFLTLSANFRCRDEPGEAASMSRRAVPALRTGCDGHAGCCWRPRRSFGAGIRLPVVLSSMLTNYGNMLLPTLIPRLVP